MTLTTKQKEDLLIALIEKHYPELVEVVKSRIPDPKPAKEKVSKKPFPDAVGYVNGLDKLENIQGGLELMSLARMVEVKSSELAKVANSLGIPVTGKVKISRDDARLIWRTYCAKRKW